MEGIPSPQTISTKRERIAMLAREAPEMVFTSLSHHINIEWMKEAFRLTRKDGAAGTDGQTAKEYASNLDVNLKSLLDRAKSGSYRAPPVRRVHIPKGDGTSTRPIGIPTFEDKVLQRAVVMVLEQVYEQDFLNSSYGFRPGRSAHQALESFWKQMMKMGGGWVIEVDIQEFFEKLDHEHLRGILDQRVRDGVLLRLIGKWLNAGVQEDGAVKRSPTGSPQGGVVSPLLSNVYLHEVMDKWFANEVKPRLKGQAFLVRYADDVVIGFAEETDARRVMEVLPKRLGKYGLTLHPEKTRLVKFLPPRTGPGVSQHEPGSFDLLGFTHFWGLSRKGKWVIKRKTAKGRFKRALMKIGKWCRLAMHQPIREQHQKLSEKLEGHYGYYGITGNAEALERFRHAVRRVWQRWLSRRSQKPFTWVHFEALEKWLVLPPAHVVHSVYRHAAKP